METNVLSYLAPFLAIAIVAVNSATTITIASCVHNGVTYSPGQSFSSSPCEHCNCHAGSVACTYDACTIPPCVDAVHDTKTCCPVCPNGRNCKARDGKIIQLGEKYHPDSRTTCECVDSDPWYTVPVCSSVGIPGSVPATVKPLVVS